MAIYVISLPTHTILNYFFLYKYGFLKKGIGLIFPVVRLLSAVEVVLDSVTSGRFLVSQMLNSQQLPNQRCFRKLRFFYLQRKQLRQLSVQRSLPLLEGIKLDTWCKSMVILRDFPLYYCWWFRNPAFTSWGKGSLSYYLQGFYTFQGGWLEWDFSHQLVGAWSSQGAAGAVGDLSLETAAVPGWGVDFFFGGDFFGVIPDIESCFFFRFWPIFQAANC